MTASLRQWEYVMGVNFFGVGHTLRHFVPKMMDQEAPGAIVTTASLTGIRVGAGLCAAPLWLVACCATRPIWRRIPLCLLAQTQSPGL